AKEPVGESLRTETDVDGRFRFELHARDGEEIVVRHVDSSFDVRARASLGDEQVELVAPEETAVALRALDEATGVPLPGFVLRWRWEDPSGGDAIEVAWQVDVDRGDAGAIPLPVGIVSLEVDASAIGYAPLAIERFEVPAAEPRPPREIRVRRVD
ncbi:MAG: hypothetical protein ACF8XB_14530, partial [Planctomycetota bacterium JB042]